MMEQRTHANVDLQANELMTTSAPPLINNLLLLLIKEPNGPCSDERVKAICTALVGKKCNAMLPSIAVLR